jgi:quercetin dioxygenase-like cupin family protein
MFERYTERARRVLFYARYEASKLGSTSIETEHLLLGLVREASGRASTVIGRSRMSLDSVRREIESRPDVRENVPISVEIPFSQEAKRILNFTVQEADRLRHNDIDTEHLLLGILREENGFAARTLNGHGMTLEAVRDEIAGDRGVPQTNQVAKSDNQVAKSDGAGAIRDCETGHPAVVKPADHAQWRADKMGKSTIYESARLLVGLNAFEPGQSHALHAHVGTDKMYYVLDGNGVFLLEGRELPMQAGDLLVAPDGVPHGVKNTGTGRLLVLAVLAPAP